METNVLQFITSKSLTSTIHIYTNPSTVNTTPQTRNFIPHRRRWLRLCSSTNGTEANEDTPQVAPPTITPPEPMEIRFRRRSKKRNKQQREGGVGRGQSAKAQAPDPPKKWEDMSLAEKALELYMGEKGILFWLNKFAYASIFIVIGGWILFRFVGPSLNLYQLDTQPLPPSSMFKGS
ncbi:uncharacterized protein LOC8267098 [Ricinus communis]|uniref:Transmembrane protein n=1 Tax=Ricinus communis TaxID=3988 RepID=B9SXL8_RICCO|nr:uncharacterized protein LOC8267098 [Ricinus communis]EEF31643.1 conserved hypothetical protein [Ricinus communis]|eukprot:XP_002530737.1 uncharacterized protein LOC8267098 [Ricinus communis]